MTVFYFAASLYFGGVGIRAAWRGDRDVSERHLILFFLLLVLIELQGLPS